ncbi:unnamed protein product [Chrysodeixis includens]|uniref:Uncharacterized protein n=1 Tax=Chrysodeixis includens TaxID=689277 RepID=A0A9N8L388_CHRIL|nr:unnamed protein product [Chrysodeixis includens]
MRYELVGLNPHADVRVCLNALIIFYNSMSRHAAFLATLALETPRTCPAHSLDVLRLFNIESPLYVCSLLQIRHTLRYDTVINNTLMYTFKELCNPKPGKRNYDKPIKNVLRAYNSIRYENFIIIYHVYKSTLKG